MHRRKFEKSEVLVEFEVVLVVIVGAGVGVEVVLQLVLQGAVGGLRTQQVGVLALVGGQADGADAAFHQHREGGKAVQDERKDQDKGNAYNFADREVL